MFCYIFKVSFLLFFVGDFDLSRFLVAVYNKDKNTVESNKQKHDMFLKNALSEKICCHNKKSFVIYNMNNNSLIETENSGRGLVFIFVYFYFVDFVFPWIFYNFSRVYEK